MYVGYVLATIQVSDDLGYFLYFGKATFLEADMPPSSFPLLGDSSLRGGGGGGGVFLADLEVTESKSGWSMGGLNKRDEA